LKNIIENEDLELNENANEEKKIEINDNNSLGK